MSADSEQRQGLMINYLNLETKSLLLIRSNPNGRKILSTKYDQFYWSEYIRKKDDIVIDLESK